MFISFKVSAAPAVGLAFAGAVWLSAPGPDPTDLVTLPPASFGYRVAGEFLRDSAPVNPPVVAVGFDRTVVIMKHHVSRADYQRCVDDGACRPIDAPFGPDAASVPAVGVNWYDAASYAAWLSRETGRRYRLPTDAEWAYAAGSQFRDPSVVDEADAANPAKRWIATYESESASSRGFDTRPQPFGSFGVNRNGLADIAGNVWDWTSTCFTRRAMSSGVDVSTVESCGIRVVEGAHRTYISDFVRNSRGGGCSAGTPPSNLGIRLVRDDATLADRIVDLFRNLSLAATGHRAFELAPQQRSPLQFS